jgi:hypothetical protein
LSDLKKVDVTKRSLSKLTEPIKVEFADRTLDVSFIVQINLIYILIGRVNGWENEIFLKNEH